ncbi:MAG: (d)CMP kinase [Pseudomonadota bacterium]
MAVVIAIDGPAASGKGTLARRIAEEFGFHHLDTGLLYRATAQSLLRSEIALHDAEAAARAARDLKPTDLSDPDLSSHSVGEAASRVAVIPEVRQALFELQRGFAAREPGAVLDGRDIASVICPDADVKLFVTASADVRAGRRHAEEQSRGKALSYNDVLTDIRQRDARDQTRAVAPLKPAEDAHLIDTSEMDIETAFQTALGIVNRALG